MYKTNLMFIAFVFINFYSFGKESFFPPGMINTEEEFLIEQKKDISHANKRIDFYARSSICDEKCKRNLEVSKFSLENSYKRAYHAKVLVREELSNRLWNCVDEIKSEKLYPCFDAEWTYIKTSRKCGKLGSFSSKESKSCLLNAKKDLDKKFEESKVCENSNKLIAFDNVHYISGQRPFYVRFSENKELPKTHNDFLKKFYKCTNEKYHEASKFRFNPEISSFLTGSKKRQYLSLLDEYLEKEYFNLQGKEKKFFYYSPSYRGGNFLINFYNSIFKERLTGKESFIKEMIKDTKFNRSITDIEAAKKYLGRTVPISHPDNATSISQMNEDKSFDAPMKYSYLLDSRGEFVSGWAQVDKPITNQFTRYLPEFDEMGKVIWKNRDKGQVSWIKLDTKILELLDGHVKDFKNNRKGSIQVNNLKGESALIFTVIDRGNVSEYKVSKQMSEGTNKYIYQGKYEGYATKTHLYDLKHSKKDVVSLKEDDEAKRKEISKAQEENLKNIESSDIVNTIKKQDSVAIINKEEVEPVSDNAKEVSNVSVTQHSYQSLVNGCNTKVNNVSLDDIHTNRTNSLLSMINKLDDINCSSLEGKGCHSEQARKLIMQHYSIEKNSYHKAMKWKVDAGNEDATRCLKLYGFMR